MPEGSCPFVPACHAVDLCCCSLMRAQHLHWLPSGAVACHPGLPSPPPNNRSAASAPSWPTTRESACRSGASCRPAHWTMMSLWRCGGAGRGGAGKQWQAGRQAGCRCSAPLQVLVRRQGVAQLTFTTRP